MKSITKKIFNEILKNTEGAFIPEGMTNPVKIIGDEMIMYCAYKGKIFECLLDYSALDKLKNMGTFIAHLRKNRDEVYFLSSLCKSLHRYLIDCPEGKVVDHKNGNSLNNKLENLRVVSQGTNMLNKAIYKNNVHGIPNVTIKKGFIIVYARRKFCYLTYAKEAAEKMNEVLNHYSELDAAKRRPKNKKLKAKSRNF